jgi:hypothetical protein
VPRGYVYAGGAVVGAAVIYGLRKNKQQGAANASAPSAPAGASSGDPYPADGSSGDPVDPYSTDPATGQTYGDEGQFASGSGQMTDLGYGGGYYPPGVAGGGVTYTTNAQWSQAAEAYLTNTVSADPATVAAALGKYITGQPVTEAQVSVIEQAIAFGGQPPVEGPGGYPPSFHPASSGGGTGTPGTGKPPAPPKTAPDPVSVSAGNGAVLFSWPAVGGAAKYQVDVTGTKNSQLASPTVTATHASINLPAGEHLVKVRAGNAAGWGPYGAVKTFTVPGTGIGPLRK